MDIDSLFKTPKLASGGNKRRMPDAPTPEMLKKMRIDDDGSSNLNVPSSSSTASSSNTRGRAVTLEDAADDEDEDMEPRVARVTSTGDAYLDGEDDEDGRFFGGGLTTEQKDILNIFDDDGKEDAAAENLEELNITGIRRMLLRFERAVKKNQDQRSKFPDDPSKFIDSEADLDAAIQSLLPLAQSPTLAYPELVKSGIVVLLVDLMSHENVDIVIDVVSLLHELTEEDVGGEEDEDEEDQDDLETGALSKQNQALKLLVDALMEHQTMELLVSNLSRMNEEEESDRQGVYHTLGIFENTIGFNPTLANSVASETTLVKWLLDRLQVKKYDENKGYAAELLAILLQGSRENRLAFGEGKGIDVLLQVLSQFRKRDPADADQTEFMENVFDALCSALGEPANKTIFLNEEGVELMVLMMKEKMLAKSRSIKVLDYALSGPSGSENCEKFVEAAGLKTLFPAFMNKGKNKSKLLAASEDTGHILGIISSLFSNLASDSIPRIRLLSKFVDAEYEKVDRLLDIRENAITRLKLTEKEIEEAKDEAKQMGMEDGEDDGNDDLWYLRRLDGGLFTLQNVDYILGWICMEDDEVRAHAQMLLSRKGESLKDIAKVLQQYHDNVTEDTTMANGESSTTNGTTRGDEDGSNQKMILKGLITFLEGC